ncbi:hypothetical protein E2C01_097512 [Portunus trituberculatus]|uniref:Uncharacterized protein n=1 Tax=Portunus trituberculatus TaxID=210409 RepID=A0A5B7K4M3_PORTR|nr:hypothetical protein [Portunus trituberculatus]
MADSSAVKTEATEGRLRDRYKEGKTTLNPTLAIGKTVSVKPTPEHRRLAPEVERPETSIHEKAIVRLKYEGR